MRKPLLDDPINVPAVVAGSTMATTNSGSATSPIAEALPAALVGKIFIHIMPVLSLGYGLSFIDRSNIAYAGLDEHLESDVPGLVPGGTAYGLAAGLFFLGYGTMQIPVVHLLSRIGARRVLAGTLLVWGVVATAQAFVQHLGQLYVLRLCLGLAEAGYYPGSIYFLSTWLPDEVLGTASTLLTAAGAPLNIVGSITAGFIMSTDTFNGLWGLHQWRWLFLLQGFPAALIGLCLLVQLPDKPTTARWLSAEERRVLLGRLAAPGACEGEGEGEGAVVGSCEAERTPPPPPPPALRLREALCLTVRTLPVWLFSAQHFCGCTIAYVGAFFQPLLLKELLPTWSNLAISGLYSVPLAIGIPASALVSWWGDRAPAGRERVRRRAWLLWVCSTTSALFMSVSGLLLVRAAANAAGSLATRTTLSIASLTLAGLCGPISLCAAGSLWTLVQAAQPQPLRSTTISVVNSIGNLGGFVGPYLLSALRQPLGPTACVDGKAKCVTQWGGAIAAVGGLLVAINAINIFIACKVLLPRMLRDRGRNGPRARPHLAGAA